MVNAHTRTTSAQSKFNWKFEQDAVEEDIKYTHNRRERTFIKMMLKM